MKKPIVALMLVALLLFAGCEATPWKEFESKEGGFSVMMPGPPAEKRQTFNTQLGSVDARFFTVEAERGSSVYMVVYGDYPEALMATEDKGLLLDAARDGAVGNIQGTLLSEREISIGGHPGRELQVQSSDGKLSLQIRIYLVGSRQYQVVMVSPKSSTPAADRDRFFDSFKLKGS